MRKSKKQMTLQVLYRENDLLALRYNRFSSIDSITRTGIAIFKRHFPDKPLKGYLWNCEFESFHIEDDLREQFNVDYPRMLTILDKLYETKNRYVYTSY